MLAWVTAVSDSVTTRIAALMGRSAYQPPPPTAAPSLDSPEIIRARANMGGQLQLPITPESRWYLWKLEAAAHDADAGNLTQAARLMREARMDGVFAGVLSTRTGGLVRLPKRFRGDAEVIAELELGHDTTRSTFDEMFPPQELSQLAADGILLGVGVAELVPVIGRDYPVLVRLEPEFLRYRWIENRWYFQSAHSLIPITPGDGRWILHTPGGRLNPWINGIWRAIGRCYIRKDHAALHKDNWEAKLANPARVAVAPQGATEEQSDGWFRAVMAWSVNTVFGLKPGYDCKLIESNGRGWESFNKTIADQNSEMLIAVAGQTVTTTGGDAAFQNSDIHRAIRSDLIKDTADSLAYTLNTQGIPAFVAALWGDEAIESKPCVVEWDVTPPKDRAAEATALVSVASAIKSLGEALGASGELLDVGSLLTRFGVPVLGDDDRDGVSETAPSADKPRLRLVAGTDAQPAEPAAEGDGAASDGAADASGDDAVDEPKADSALNGAQVTSLLEVVGQVAAGQLPRDSALEILSLAFGWPREQADRVLGSVGKGFEPTSASVDVAPTPPPAAPPPDAEVAA